MKKKSLSTPMTFAVYPRERDELHRLRREHRLKSNFDVVRLLAATPNPVCRPGSLDVPKKKI